MTLEKRDFFRIVFEMRAENILEKFIQYSNAETMVQDEMGVGEEIFQSPSVRQATIFLFHTEG